jgi:hypothetical protein
MVASVSFVAAIPTHGYAFFHYTHISSSPLPHYRLREKLFTEY